MKLPRLALASLAALALGGCTFSTTATHWNGRVGPDGKPVYVMTHTNIGLNLLIIIPTLGRTSLPDEIDKLTDQLATEKGDDVRMVESSSENYWYGFAPVTWVLTPVITTVSAEYHPAPDVLAKDQAEQAAKKAEQEKSK
jgi:hypothetical protein